MLISVLIIGGLVQFLAHKIYQQQINLVWPYDKHDHIYIYAADESEFRPVYSLDMRIRSQNCPPSLRFRQNGDLRLCGKKTNGPSCDSVTIPTNGQSYSKVLGKIKAYQYGTPDCFYNHPQNIDRPYVDGISITYGSSPRIHVWTYAVAWRQFQAGRNRGNKCPSTGGGDGPWDFVGDDYFCSSGNSGTGGGPLYTKYPLWSNIQGNCSFCGKNDLSFCTELGTSTTDDLELRVCTDENLGNEDIRIETIEFYIG